MSAYYNENDPYAAQWLRNLIAEGLIAKGDVDDRSIKDVRPADVAGYRQCHWFAGIGGWSLALRLAGWADDRECWTGSCPCQPFSAAGKQRGFDDERHLWPVWRELIRERRPAIVFGEQVASASAWLGLVRGDLEALGYAVGAMPIQAACVGADHLRDRFWIVADGPSARQFSGAFSGVHPEKEGCGSWHGELKRLCDSRNVADTNDTGSQGWPVLPECADQRIAGQDGMADADELRASEERQQRSGQLGWIGGDPQACDWVIGHDGKARRVKPGIRLLAHGIPNRVGKLRAYGNAIVPQVAAEFIGAYMDCAPQLETTP